MVEVEVEVLKMRLDGVWPIAWDYPGLVAEGDFVNLFSIGWWGELAYDCMRSDSALRELSNWQGIKC